jgi:hypothetical protein
VEQTPEALGHGASLALTSGPAWNEIVRTST